MEQLLYRTLFVLLQAAVGVIVFGKEISQRLRGGRGGFRLPQRRRPAVFLTDLFFWLGVAGWVGLGVSWFFAPDSRSLFGSMTAEQWSSLQIIGLLVGAAAVFFITAGIWSLGTSFRTSIDYDETPRLVTTGIYRAVRNPMAIGLLLHGWAGFLLHQSWGALAAAVILHITNRLRVHWEEQYLSEALGEEFEEFRRTTGRFFPRIQLNHEDTKNPKKNKTG